MQPVLHNLHVAKLSLMLTDLNNTWKEGMTDYQNEERFNDPCVN